MKLFALLLLLCIAIVTTGCGTSEVTAGNIRWKMADDLYVPGKTWSETNNQMYRTMIANKRSRSADVVRLLLLDRPTRAMYDITTTP